LAATRGDVEPGIALLAEGLPVDADHPRFTSTLTELALRLGMAGAVEPARRLADQLLHRAEDNGELWICSEVQRVRGELCEDEEVALSLFERAVETAQAQGARAWGLRAATSLARRRRGASSLLARWMPVEGLWTRDVKAANQILQNAMIDQV
jgi:hypothetical protein